MPAWNSIDGARLEQHFGARRHRIAVGIAATFSGTRKRWRSAARTRILVYAALISMFLGGIGFLEPVDDAIRNLRFLARSVPADSTVVVVGIDEKSLAAMNQRYPWPRAEFAKLVDNLKKAGANKILFDKALADTDTPDNDRAFIDVANRYKGDIFLGAGFGQSQNGSIDGMLLPAETIRPHVGVATFKTRYNLLGQIDQVYLQAANGKNHYPSISAVVSGQRAEAGVRVRPDFSIAATSIPYLSASDVIRKPGSIRPLKGADVIVGDVARSLGDIRFLPSQGAHPGVYVHAIAAQTLRSGMPVDAGWFAPWLLAVAASVLIVFVRSRFWQISVNLLAVVAAAAVPILLDSNHISIELSPALLMLGIAAVQNARLRLGWQKSRMNENSGLANIVALRELKSLPGTAVVAAKIDNYAAICASFPRDVEGTIVAEIVSRLRLRDEGIEIYQADDGVFYWVSHVDGPTELGHHLEGLKALFSAALQIGDRRVDVAISFGADLDSSRTVASRASSALLCAEEALRTGKRWKLYDPKRTADAAWQLSLASEIDRGIEAEEFWLAYQPKLDLKTGRITGAEILLRWQHPDRGNISPAEFIPAAERSQRIGPLTDYVVDRALAASQLLSADGDYKLAINVSVPILGDSEFAATLASKCKKAGVPAKRIMVEITESVLMSADDDQVEKTLEALRQSGFGLSIDDFGTGFSSLEYVRSIPAHEMKIDQSFVKRVLTSAADRVVVESVLRMAHELGRNVVAEGVEDAETLDLLRKLGCDEVQGYHVGRPVDFMSFRARLQKDRTDAHIDGQAAA